MTAAATLGEPRPSPQKSSLPRAHNGPRFAPWGLFFRLAATGTSPPEFLSPSHRSLLFFLLFLRSFLASFVPFFSGFRLRAKFRPRANRTAALFLGRRRVVRGEWNCRYSRLVFSRSTRRNPSLSFDGIVRSWLPRQIGRTASQESNASRVNTTVAEAVSRSNRSLCATNLKSDQRRTVNWRTPRRIQEPGGVFDKLLPNYCTVFTR